MPLLGAVTLEGAHDLYADSTGALILTETLEARPVHTLALGTEAFVLAVDEDAHTRTLAADLSAVQAWRQLEFTEGVRLKAGARPTWYVDANWPW